MGKNDNGENGSVDVILPDGFGSSFSSQQIRAKVISHAKTNRIQLQIIKYGHMKTPFDLLWQLTEQNENGYFSKFLGRWVAMKKSCHAPSHFKAQTHKYVRVKTFQMRYCITFYLKVWFAKSQIWNWFFLSSKVESVNLQFLVVLNQLFWCPLR